MWGHPSELEKSENFLYILNHENMVDEKKEKELEELDNRSTPLSSSETISNMTLGLRANINQPKVLVEVEKRAQGYVQATLLLKYCVALGGALFWLSFVLIFLSARGFNIAGSLWIKKWTDDLGFDNTAHDLQPTEHGTRYYIQVYTILMLTQLIFSIMSFAVVYIGALRAGRLLFAEMLERIFRAPLRFFGKSASAI